MHEPRSKKLHRSGAEPVSLSSATEGKAAAEDNSETVANRLGLGEHVEEHIEVGGRRVRRRGIYLLPNLFTTGALFAGFLAMVFALRNDYGVAALAVFSASILDGLDGRIARLVHAQSSFGEQYDSISDVISFGMAPALVVYIWALDSLGGVGQATAFAFLACIALRLARFNSQVDSTDSVRFAGLASPAAAVLLVSMVWLGSELNFLQWSFPSAWLICVLTGLTALLTVVNIPYRSFKEVDFRGRVPFAHLFVLLLIFIAIAIDPPRMMFVFALAYALSGPLEWLWRRGYLRAKRPVENS